MAAETQAHCLRVLEQASSVGTAARTSILAAFTSGQGYSADADYSPRAWLIHKTQITRGAAVGYTAWVRRAAAHPQVAAALAAGVVSVSVARTICLWTDKLPEDCQQDADAILLAAAGGADVADLAGLAGEIYARSLPEDEDQDEGGAFGDRSVRVETATFGRRRGHDRGPDPGVRLAGGHGAGRAGGPGRGGGCPEPAAALP